MPSSLIAPVVGAVVGQVIGGAGRAAGGAIQAGAAGAAAEQFEPFVDLGTTAAERSRQLFLGSPEEARGGIEAFRNSPDFLLGQKNIGDAARNAGFALSAQGRNPFTAGGDIASGSGLQAFLQAANQTALGNFNQFADRLGQFRREGISAAGGAVQPIAAQGSALGGVVSGAADTVGGLFGQTPGQPGTNLFNNPANIVSPSGVSALPGRNIPFVNPDLNRGIAFFS